MATTRGNILANLVGGGWIAFLTLVITPLQIHILGMGAYGLVGFIATLQVVFSTFDFGLSSTLTRELASDPSPKQADSRPLIRTATSVYWSVALLMGGALAMAAGPLASAWFKSGGVDLVVIEEGLRVIAVFLALRWPVALYSGILSGLQRMDLLNAVKASSASIRLLGGIGVLLLWRDISVFLLWTSVSAVVEVLAYFMVCRRTVPDLDLRPGFSWPALRAVWTYSLSMNAIAVLTMLITQLDRLMVSKMLTLESLGYYSLAYNTASAVLLILSAISSAMMPAFAEAVGQQQRDTLLRRYAQSNQAMLLTTGLVAFPLVFFGEAILALWVGRDAAGGAWLPLALLAAGFWFGAAVSNAFSAAVAYRRPDLPLWVSALSVPPYALLLYFGIEAAGPGGAAGASMALNLIYLLVLLPLVHRHLLRAPIVSWFTDTLLPVLILGAGLFSLMRWLAQTLVGDAAVLQLLLLAFAMLAYAAIGYRLLSPDLRAGLLGLVRGSRIGRSG